MPAAAARAADAGTIVKSAGAVEATLSWGAGEFGVTNPHLRIVRGGVAVFDASISDVCGEGCILVADASGQDSILHVADLDHDGEPEVVVDAYSGGAHCCITAEIYDFRAATGTYGHLSVYWGNGGYRLRDLGGDGLFEMIGDDDAFAYAFTSYAGSARPPRILRYAHGPDGAPVTVDVTRKFPKVVRADAKRLRKVIDKGHRGDDLRGIVAAYVADEYLLRRGPVGLRVLDRAGRRGLLTGSTPRAYRGAVLRVLRKQGYR